MGRLLIWVFVLVMLVAGWVGACVVYQAAEMGARVGPLEPRQFDRFTLVAVGTGGPYENPARGGPCMATGLGSRIVLVDAGRAVAEGLRAAKIPVSQPDTVLLTHLLPENTVGLDDLLFAGWLGGRDRPLRVIGPVGTQALVDGLLAGYAATIAAQGDALGLSEAGSQIEVEEVGDGWSEERDGLALRAGALPGGPTAALAWRIEAGGRSVVVSGTGWSDDALVAFSDGSDVLVHEAIYVPTPADMEAAGIVDVDLDLLRREEELHTSILEVGALAERTGVETLVLVRMRPPPMFDIQVTGELRKHFSGGIWIPDDGDELEP
ncbi:MAG: hypothetical protein O7A09_03830 [Proteobacteria bacterium]|nr:hypothetical protein [Pseudomonadota bacterium]